MSTPIAQPKDMAVLSAWQEVDSQDYHDGPGVSATDLKRILRSPAHYKAPRKEPSPIMIQGAALHCYVLEPKLFEARYMVLPEGVTRVHKEGKALAEQAKAQGKDLISFDQFQAFPKIREAVLNHPLAGELMAGAKYEQSGYWTEARLEPRVLCKIRPDILREDILCIGDLKTTDTATPEAFQRVAWSQGYHIQAAQYLHGATMVTNEIYNDFVIIAVEREDPFGVCVYRVDDEMITEGLKLRQKALETYAECLAKDSWPCYDPALKTLSLPGWVKRSAETVIFDF